MRAGRLDRRITLQRWTPSSPDSHGQEQGSWLTLAMRWAERRFVSGRERLEASQTLAGQVEVFRVRGDLDVTPRDRLVFEGVAYDIQSVAEIGRREGHEITAVARAEAFQAGSG